MSTIAESLEEALRFLIKANTSVCYRCEGNGTVPVETAWDAPKAITEISGQEISERCPICDGAGVLEHALDSPTVGGGMCAIILREVLLAREAENFGAVDELLDWAQGFLALAMSTTEEDISTTLSTLRERISAVDAVRARQASGDVPASASGHGALSTDELAVLLADGT